MGHRPLPKPPDQRARRNRDPVPQRVIAAAPAPPPPLPRRFPGPDGAPVPVPSQTRRWWRTWVESPLAATFTAGDWSELLDTALIHARFWSGDVKQAAELRLRVARFGATPDDRARLRITFAQADAADTLHTPPPSGGARDRYAPLIDAASDPQREEPQP